METLQGKLIVKFDRGLNDDFGKYFDLGGIKILKAKHLPETNEDHDKGFENKLEENKQIATVHADNKKYNIRKGDVVFLHYMAYEWVESIEIDGDSFDVVDAEYVFFKIVNDDFVMQDDVYLGEQLYKNELKLDSGIYLNVDKSKETSRIKITHIPSNSTNIKVGDVVLSIDGNEYEVNINGKKYVKLLDREIVGILE